MKKHKCLLQIGQGPPSKKDVHLRDLGIILIILMDLGIIIESELLANLDGLIRVRGVNPYDVSRPLCVVEGGWCKFQKFFRRRLGPLGLGG